MKRKGFTLSEVMLVLSVIGVIATLTIPGIMQNTQNKQTVTRLKKIYSLLQQAYTSNVAEYESAENYSVLSNVSYVNAFVSNMSVLKNCGNNPGCWHIGPTKGLDGSEIFHDFNNNDPASYSWGKVILADGTFITGGSYANNCTTSVGTAPDLQNSICGKFFVDVNGLSGPNVFGRDVFGFYITKRAVVPYGIIGDFYSCSGTGMGCANKILSENAVNY